MDGMAFGKKMVGEWVRIHVKEVNIVFGLLPFFVPGLFNGNKHGTLPQLWSLGRVSNSSQKHSDDSD
ncbi:unnamed protein product [Sphenostylis stenocarpa]|uniref:Uncharacterized protein n=1 Tax=Sphenostylis stenocarpa TaxID=92480 RepID=A0AA86RUU3_9FABA|nr:unnamed protein product [Sphenostylis stenocarpa]